jgi:hypothetical protein
LPNKGQYDHPDEEDDMAHNYAHGPSMFDHFGPPTTTLQKVIPSGPSK